MGDIVNFIFLIILVTIVTLLICGIVFIKFDLDKKIPENVSPVLTCAIFGVVAGGVISFFILSDGNISYDFLSWGLLIVMFTFIGYSIKRIMYE